MTKKKRLTKEVEEQIVDQPEETKSGLDYQELYLRTRADLENLQKRQEQERQALIKYAGAELILELLPVIDNFYRATEHIPAEQKENSWVTGIQHIQKQLLDVLDQRGVQEIPLKPGDPFDHLKAEAIGTTVDERYPEDSIAEIAQRGYVYHEKVIRPARVIVTAKPATETQAEPTK
jgi:molecular chaperone GrpE